MLLKGKRALVTGGGRGIGQAVALAYAREGASVAICGRNQEALKASEAQLQELGVPTVALVCDVTDPAQAKQLVADVTDRFGGIDILANIAGVSPKQSDGMKIPFWELTDETWQEVMDINLNSMFYLSKAVAPQMIARQSGRIVNMSSVVGLTSSEHSPAAACYTTSKTGVVGLTRALAYELGPYNVTVNCVAAGRIATAMSAANNQYYNDLHLQLIPLKRFGTPEEVAELFVFLASDKAAYITGEAANITGGWFL